MSWFVQRLQQYYALVRLPIHVHNGRRLVGLHRSATFLNLTWHEWDLPVLVHKGS